MLIEFLKAIPFTFAALFPVLNPLGCAVLFLALTVGATQEELNHAALKVAINTSVLLIVVLLTGSWILAIFGITIPIVEIGGGMVIAYIGWTLLNQPSSEHNTPSDVKPSNKNIKDLAFFPLTMPLTAGPGCIAITLTIGAHQLSGKITDAVVSGLGTVVGILLCSIVVYFCYSYAKTVKELFGSYCTKVIMRLSAFINLCIGLQIVWNGVQGLI